MLIQGANQSVATSISPFAPGEIFAEMKILRRDTKGLETYGDFSLVEYPSGKAQRVGGGFTEAVRSAQALADVPVSDTLHRLPINQLHAVLQAKDGAYWVLPIGADHRGFTGPLFIDGAFARRVSLTAFAHKKTNALQALVGSEMMLDLRRPQKAGLQPIEGVLKRELTGDTPPPTQGEVPAVPLS